MLTSAEQTRCLKQCVQHVSLLLLLLPPLLSALLHFCAGNSVWDPAVWQCICAEARLMKAFLFTFHATAPSAHGSPYNFAGDTPVMEMVTAACGIAGPAVPCPLAASNVSPIAAAAPSASTRRWATLPALHAAHTRSAPLAM